MILSEGLYGGYLGYMPVCPAVLLAVASWHYSSVQVYRYARPSHKPRHVSPYDTLTLYPTYNPTLHHALYRLYCGVMLDAIHSCSSDQQRMLFDDVFYAIHILAFSDIRDKRKGRSTRPDVTQGYLSDNFLLGIL